MSLAAFSYARQISFQVIQHGAGEVRGETYAVEDALLDWFFDNGDIVTNEPCAAMDESESAAALNAALVPAKNGGAQYFVQIRLFYSGNTASENAVRLDDIERVRWTVTDVTTGREVAGKNIRVEKDELKKTGSDGVKEFAAGIAGDVRNALAKN